MIKNHNFQTRARTLDHLGREQIADVPTAISELWKNAYDAYATHANLTLYDSSTPVVAICDDGHGMSYQEFVDRWLVIGTETKLFGTDTPKEDRFGQAVRPKQGQKGIGRLSSAHLGPVMLLVSKRKTNDFVVALLDWRVFENPYLLLSDIKVPVTEVKSKDEVLSVLPGLFDGLMENIWGENKGSGAQKNSDRSDRIVHAWKLYDAADKEEYEAEKKQKTFDGREWKSPSEKIAETIIASRFDSTHFEAWPVWSGEVDHGTAMLVSKINLDFEAYLQTELTTGTEKYIQDRFFQTLSAFVDPYHDDNEGPIKSQDVNGAIPRFTASFDVVLAEKRTTIVGKLPFDRTRTNEMEHVLFGTIDESGNFSGCVKAFGKWRKTDYEYEIRKPADLKMPVRSDTRLGRCDIYLSTIEIEKGSSTHTDADHASMKALADRYASFTMFRDGLRVLPYGREENDFFEIETRRSFNAGQYFWNKRRMFGRVALRRSENPNLRDKAGREGFIDNAASKVLKKLIINVLNESANDYFGRRSEMRSTELPTIQEQNKEKKAQEKAEEDTKKLKAKRKREFASNVKKANAGLPKLVEEMNDSLSNSIIQTTKDVEQAQVLLENIREQLGALTVRGSQPTRITNKVQLEFQSYKSTMAEASNLVSKLVSKIDADIDRVDPKEPWELLESQIQRGMSGITRRLNNWDRDISALLDNEGDRVVALKVTRKEVMRQQAEPILALVREERMPLTTASKKVETIRSDIDDENAEIFEGYISALESLKESIDLQNIALHGVYDTEDLRAEVERLNELAQLGIAVEILGHELISYDNMIGSGLSALPKDVRNSRAAKSIETGYQGLSKQLNFLAPLKISGQRSFEKISGQDIIEYLQIFFEQLLERRKITLTPSNAFLNFSLYDQPARLYPVFINLVNNSQYWLSTKDEADKQIILDVIDGKVVVSDNGPGIDAIDEKRLFQLFFTRKSRGGRGVGLYLCRANLRAAGHDITYSSTTKSMPLSGANFLINFSNAEFS